MPPHQAAIQWQRSPLPVDAESGKRPDGAALRRIHAGAHKNGFITNSIKARVTVPTPEATA